MREPDTVAIIQSYIGAIAIANANFLVAFFLDLVSEAVECELATEPAPIE